MAKNDPTAFERASAAGNEALGWINQLDDASKKFQPGERQGSIIKAAQQNVFEFPVFISNSIPMEYATATSSLLEQLYAAYLQMAVSINPVIDAKSIKNGLQFANYKTNTNKYLEYAQSDYQKDAAHAVYQEGVTKFTFDMVAIDDNVGKFINESMDYVPLSEFEHFFQEGSVMTKRENLQSSVSSLMDTMEKIVELDRKHQWNNNTFVRNFKTTGGMLAGLMFLFPATTGSGQGHTNIKEAHKWIKKAIKDKMGNITPEQKRALSRLYDLTEDLWGTVKLFWLNPLHWSKRTDLFINDKKANRVKKLAQIARRVVDLKPSLEFIMDDNFVSESWTMFQEAPDYDSEDYYQTRYPMPRIETDSNGNKNMVFDKDEPVYQTDASGNIVYGTLNDVAKALQGCAQNPLMRNRRGESQTPMNYWMGRVNDMHMSTLSQADRDAITRRRNEYEASQQPPSTFHRVANNISTTTGMIDNVAGAVNNTANAVYNVATLPSRISSAKSSAMVEKDKSMNLDHDRAMRDTGIYAKAAAKAPEYVDDAKCNKLNTMKPLMMRVTVNMLNKDDSLQPINYIIGVKTHNRVIPASILPEVARYPLKEMDKLTRKVKWRAGEMKFLKDLVFRINEKKQTAADARDPNRKWYRRLYELAHMKGDAPAASVIQGKSLFATFIRDKQGKGKIQHGMIPNASIVMSQSDVDNIKNQTDINLLKGSVAKDFCGELFLMSLVIIDTDAESIKVLLPDMDNDFDVQSLASVNKQLATLDTAGTKTRDMFKLLG